MTDYTTVARVKQEMHIISGSSADDALLALLVTAASRAWDRQTTGVPDAVNYFMTEAVTDEVLEGQIDYQGKSIICYPHKPIVDSVQSFSYQMNIIETSYSVAVARIDPRGPRVTAFPDGMPIDFPSKCRVTISYTGGLATSGSGLPEDMQEAVAILAARFYREAEGGLADQMGVAELGTMAYTKAWPVRVSETLKLYRRYVGWRNVA
jgi:hypothetical protein